MQKVVVTLVKMTIITMLSAVVGTGVLFAVYSLPTDTICNNVSNSLDNYRQEGQAYFWAPSIWHSKVDNFTDAIMLLRAAYPVDDMKRAVAFSPSWHLVDGSPIDTLTLAMESKQPEPQEVVWNYPLYWHGYLAILKPALFLAPLCDLRPFNLYLQLFLIVTISILFYRKLGLREMYAFLVVIAIINPLTTAMNFQNSDIFYIMLFSTMFILCKNDFLNRGNNYIYFFLLIGVVTAYFDFLTYPITALGISLCVCVLMNKEFFFVAKISEVLKKLSIYAFSWGFGYGGMWAEKWIVVYKVGEDQNVFNAAINQAVYRSSSTLSPEEGGAAFTILDVFAQNFECLLNGPLKLILLLIPIILLYFLFIRGEKFVPTKSMAVAFLFIMILPFLWYAVMKNHSYLHSFFTYRNLAITIFGLTCFFTESLREVDS